MLTFENFLGVFKRAEKKPYWVLFKGQGKGTQIGSNLQNDGVPGIEDALDDLRGVIELYGDGIYTVEQRSSPTAARGTDLHTFLYGDAQITGTGKSGAVQVGSAHPANTFFQGLDARYFFEQNAKYQNDLHSAQLKNLELQMQITALKNDKKNQPPAPGIGERLIGMVEQNPQIIERILGHQPTAAIGYMKAHKAIPESDDEDDDVEDLPIGQIDLNGLVNAATRIQSHISGHVNDLLDRLADFIEKNPAQAKNLLSMLP